jgi:hypothetical protein
MLPPHTRRATATPLSSPPTPQTRLLYISCAGSCATLPATVRHAQYGRLPLHIATMQQGEASLEEIKALLSAHPQAAMEKDNVCAAARSHLSPV